MSTQFLTPEEKVLGIKHHYRQQRYNGSGFNFLGDTPVYLLAIHFGASNTQLGFISSTIFLTGILLSLVPRIFAGANLVKLQSIGWFLRGIVCLSYSALFFLEGKSAVYLIMTTYTLFCSFRVLGVAVYQPIIKMISTNRTRGSVLAASTVQFQWPLSVSRGISFLVTSIKQLSGVTGILFLQFAGIVLNTLAAWEMRKIPCRETIKYTPGRNVFIIAGEALKKKEFRYSLILSWVNSSLMVIFGFIVPFLRREAQLTSNMIFLYTLSAGLASIFAGLYTQGFADRIGSRPLLLGGNILLAICSILWILSPPDIGLAFYYIFGFLTTFALITNILLTNRLVVKSMPEGDSVGYSSMLNFFMGFIAFLIGLAGGFLADLPSSLYLDIPNTYSLTFILALLLCLFSLFLSFRLSDAESLSPRKAASIMFSLNNLATYQKIGLLRKTEDPVEKKTLLLNLGTNHSEMAANEIRALLYNPLSSIKGQSITGLFSHPRNRLLPNLLAEAEDPWSYHRLKAIFALGAYPARETEELLNRLLLEDDSAVRSNAAKSLGRIGAVSKLDEIRKLSQNTHGIWDYLNYTIALKHLDREGLYLRDLFRKENTEKGKTFTQSLYSLYSQLLHFHPPLDEIFQSRNMSQGQGLNDFLDEARDDDGFFNSHSDFLIWFESGEYKKIWFRCRELIANKKFSSYYENLKHTILSYPVESGNYDDALAATYFTYQLIKQMK